MANDAATITMNMREVDRLKTVQAVVDRMTRVDQAGKRPGLSRRQLERLIQRYKEDGVAGLVSRRRGRPSNHQLAPGIAERAIGLIRDSRVCQRTRLATSAYGCRIAGRLSRDRAGGCVRHLLSGS